MTTAIVILSSVAALILLALAGLLMLAASVPWWVFVAYYAMRSSERSVQALASAPKRVHFVYTRADARP